jgi:hypothetical protein
MRDRRTHATLPFFSNLISIALSTNWVDLSCVREEKSSRLLPHNFSFYYEGHLITLINITIK